SDLSAPVAASPVVGPPQVRRGRAAHRRVGWARSTPEVVWRPDRGTAVHREILTVGQSTARPLLLCRSSVNSILSAQPTGPHLSAQPTGPHLSAQPTGPHLSAQPTPAYECSPTVTRLMKNRLNTIATKPMTLIQAALRSRQPAVDRACRYAAYTTHAMNDTVSLGSHPQYRPHASSAQIAPKITPNPNTGNAKIVARYATRSRVWASGSRSTIRAHRPSPATWPNRDIFTTNRMLATPAARNTPEPRLTTDTWIGSQYDCSAGITGAASV